MERTVRKNGGVKMRVLIDLDEIIIKKAEEVAKKERRSRKQILEFAVEKGLENM